MNILIVTGGNIEIDFALDFLKEKKFDEIIAVDGALSFFDKVGEKIKKVGKLTHIVGDFDTISAEILKKYQMDAHIRCHSFNPEKDYTDTDIALKLAQIQPMTLGQASRISGVNPADLAVLAMVIKQR